MFCLGAGSARRKHGGLSSFRRYHCAHRSLVEPASCRKDAVELHRQ